MQFLTQAFDGAVTTCKKVNKATQNFQTLWDKKSPTEKATFVGTALVLTVFEPLVPIAWAATYAATTDIDDQPVAAESKDETTVTDD